MNKIVGKIKNIIYQNDTNGYLVALFKISEVFEEETKDYLKKTITITGNFLDLKMETPVILVGNINVHDKYGEQFNVLEYEYIVPKDEENIIEFLSSPFIKGCGKKTALKIVSVYGKDTIDIIKNDKYVLDQIDGINESKRDKIYESIINYSKSSDIILKLKELGFNIEESGKIYTKYRENVEDIVNNNIYLLNEIIDFKRLDIIFLNNYQDKYDKRRVKACIIETMKTMSFNLGDVYTNKSDIYTYLNKLFNISTSYELFLDYINELEMELFIVTEDEKCYLEYDYYNEISIVDNLKLIQDKNIKRKEYLDKIHDLERKINIEYNNEQITAINESLNNNITIISGGPGTGKTTIINAIVKLYISINKLNNIDISEQIALLAPTGRAAKKMSLSTGLNSSTIHRFLKWNKDTDEFMVNEKNKNFQKLIIVDEVSMIDNALFAALLKGITKDVQLVLVGDSFQLPSVGPGFVLNDLIKSDLFQYVPLEIIYRQSDNSYIPYLARDIKYKDLQEEFINKKDDYNFIMTSNDDIKMTIKKIIETGVKKGYNENNLQVLVPIYKGENGIDSLNEMLCSIFNPFVNQKRVQYGTVFYKVNDKVLQLVNDADNNVFNGDIGYISKIHLVDNKEVIDIDFDGNIVRYQKKDLKNIKHAYAISIHKSQGSEFEHVILPISKNYYSMLYNKLLYTGVSRAKKSLILIGDPKIFYQGVLNDYGNNRKTTLKERLEKIFLHT